MADAGTVQPQYESDLSFRKIKLATIISVTNLFASSLLAFGALTLVNVPMTTEFGWTQSEYAWALTAMLWFGAAAMPVYGWLIDKIGVRPIIILGTLGVGLCTLSLGYVSGALWQFYLLFGLLGLFGGTAMAYTKVLGALFTQHRGKAMALLGIESTLAAATLPPLLNWLITDYGWRTMFFACGWLILALIPVVWLTLDEPGEIGSERRLFRRKAPQAETQATDLPDLPGLTARQVLRNRVYWMVVLATILGTAPRTGMMPFLVPMLQEKGFSQSDAVTYMSISALIAPAGTLVAGWALDKFNSSKVAVPFQTVSFTGLFVFMLATMSFGAWPLLMVAVGCSGFAFGTVRPIGSYLHIRFFGLKAFGFYFGLENSLLAIMMGAAPPVVAAMRDGSGSYTSSYLGMLATLAIAVGLYWFMGPYRYPANIGAVPIQPKPDTTPPSPSPRTARAHAG
jgi:sugar phosphate permease